MIESVLIENYKSIQKLEIALGRVTVLIGANGSGKSNILEATAFASAAANDKLDNEFLTSRGIRVTDDPRFMRSAFDEENISKDIIIKAQGEEQAFQCVLQKDNDKPYSSWIDKIRVAREELIWIDKIRVAREEFIRNSLAISPASALKDKKLISDIIRNTSQNILLTSIDLLNLNDFLIYSPENSSLRTFEQEGQIQPLGIKGEGLFKLLRVLSSEENKKRLEEIKSKLKLIDWFNDFDVSRNLAPQERSIRIKDKYLDEKLEYFDQKSSNEGFLFLLFYFCLFVSSDTPKFFAVDNIDASLNPKLCSQLMIELSDLAEKYDKQVIFTTHNPAILDGLNLNDDNQRLFAITRNKLGHTKAERILKPKPLNGKEPVRLSEAFLRGYLGGVPKNF